MLILGDAILAAKAFAGAPIIWTTFGDQVPNSLFFSVDPVAMDCAMHYLIITEPGTAIPTGAKNYLSLAAKAGLGVFESVNPWSDSYRLINLQRITL